LFGSFFNLFIANVIFMLRKQLVFSCVIALLMCTAPGVLAATFSATLVHASREAGAVDPRLKNIEATLRRQFNFASYAHVGDANASVDIPGSTRVALPDGFSLAVKTEDAGGGKTRLNVTWEQNGKKLLQTTLTAQRASPVLLGGPTYRNGTAIVAISLK